MIMTGTTHAPVSAAVPSTPPGHALQVETMLAQLGCDPAAGLNAAEVEHRHAQGGANILPDPSCRSALANCLLWSEELRKLFAPLGHGHAA